MKCAWKKCENEARENPYKGHVPIYCSKKCKNKAGVDNLRHRRKIELVEMLGGKCKICGYNKCVDGLHFHHEDPSVKEFNISYTTNWDKIKEEIKKCKLLCANCHAEVHHEMSL